MEALVDTELFHDLKRGDYEDIEIQDGEILKISSKGKIQKTKFDFDEYGSYGYDWRKGFEYSNRNEYVDDIKSVAQYYGYDSDEIDCLLNSALRRRRWRKCCTQMILGSVTPNTSILNSCFSAWSKYV